MSEQETPAEYHGESILALDVGTLNTRASLFDVVEGVYRHVASAEAPSTYAPPYFDVNEGVRHALERLKDITGRDLLDPETARLVSPATAEGVGADIIVATASAGAPLRAVLVGLLPDVSLKLVQRLAETSYLEVRDRLHLIDGRRDDKQLDVLVHSQPDIIIIGGGTEGGARDAVLKLSELVGLAGFLMPANHRARVLYVGNSAVKDSLAERIDLPLSHAPNIQPGLGQTFLERARAELAHLVEAIRLDSIGGLRELALAANGHAWPTAHAEAHLLRQFARSLQTAKGLLSANLGAGATSLVAAFGAEAFVTVNTTSSIGLRAPGILAEASLEQFKRWVPKADLSDAAIRDFLHNKAAYPFSIPEDNEDTWLEYALARVALQATLRRARPHWPRTGPRPDLLPPMSLIVGGGAALAHAPSAGLAALVLLDALQPTGITSLALDPHHLLPALGAVAGLNPLAAVQVLETSCLFDLGTVISVVGPVKLGQVVGEAVLTYDDGREVRQEITCGSLEILPLTSVQGGKLALKPRPGYDMGAGPGRSRKPFDVGGGALGVIIDARGRPISLPTKPDRRAELLQKWIWKMTAL